MPLQSPDTIPGEISARLSYVENIKFVYATIRTLERTEKSGQTDRSTDGQIDRQTDRHIDQKQYTPARIAECNKQRWILVWLLGNCLTSTSPGIRSKLISYCTAALEGPLCVGAGMTAATIVGFTFVDIYRTTSINSKCGDSSYNGLIQFYAYNVHFTPTRVSDQVRSVYIYSIAVPALPCAWTVWERDWHYQHHIQACPMNATLSRLMGKI